MGKDKIAANQVEYAITDIFKVYLNLFDECMIVNNGHVRRTYHRKKFKPFLRDRGHERTYFGGIKKGALNVCSLDGLDYEVRECRRFDWGEKKESKLEENIKLDRLRNDIEQLTKVCSDSIKSALGHIKSIIPGGCMKIDAKSIERHHEEKIEVVFDSNEKKYGSLRINLTRKDIMKNFEVDAIYTEVPSTVPNFPAPELVINTESYSSQDNLGDDDEGNFALDKIKEDLGYDPAAMREGHDMLREERVHHPNDMGEVYVSASDYSDDSGDDNDEDDKSDPEQITKTSLSIEEKMVRHLEKQNEIRAAKRKAKRAADKSTASGKGGNVNPYNTATEDPVIYVDDLIDDGESQDQDADIDVVDVTLLSSTAVYYLNFALDIESYRTEMIDEMAQTGYFNDYCFVHEIEKHNMTFDLNGLMTSYEWSLLNSLTTKSQVFLISTSDLLEKVCGELWCPPEHESVRFPFVPEALTMSYKSGQDDNNIAVDVRLKNYLKTTMSASKSMEIGNYTSNSLPTFKAGSVIPMTREMINTDKTKYKYSLSFSHKNRYQKMLFLLKLGKESVSKLKPKIVMRFINFIDDFNDAVLLASTEGVPVEVSLHLERVTSVTFGDIDYILSRAFELLDKICNITSLSDAFGVMINVDLSNQILNGADIYALMHSCTWLNSFLKLTSCGLSNEKLGNKEWSTLSLDSLSFSVRCTTICLKYNYVLMGLCKLKLPDSMSHLQLFDEFLSYFDSKGNKAIVNSDLLSVLDFKALDIWCSFLEYLMLSKGSSLRCLQLSQCARNSEELIAIIAGVLYVCRERTRIFGVAGRMKFIDLRSTLLPTSSPSLSSLMTSLDLRVRSELLVSSKDEEGKYRELEFLFD